MCNVVCREDLNYPHTAWGILNLRKIRIYSNPPFYSHRGFSPVIKVSQGINRRRRGVEMCKVVCREDLNYPHTAVWGILILRVWASECA